MISVVVDWACGLIFRGRLAETESTSGDAIVTADGSPGEMQFATATEVDGIRPTLDSFMKQQEDQNRQLNSKFDQVMSYLTKMADKSNTVIVEDASSSINVTHPSSPA